MPVAASVPKDSKSVASPAHRIQSAESSPTKAAASASAAGKVATASTPSRDSQLDRHWLKARQARSGRPRWKVEDKRPNTVSAKARANSAMTAAAGDVLG